MMLLSCPWCGKRSELEFDCGGQSHIERPSAPDQVSDEEWANYLFFRHNPKGIHLERWRHTHGCEQWFNIARDTHTHKVIAAYRMGESSPPSLQTSDKKGGEDQ